MDRLVKALRVRFRKGSFGQFGIGQVVLGGAGWGSPGVYWLGMQLFGVACSGSHVLSSFGSVWPG